MEYSCWLDYVYVRSEVRYGCLLTPRDLLIYNPADYPCHYTWLVVCFYLLRRPISPVRYLLRGSNMTRNYSSTSRKDITEFPWESTEWPTTWLSGTPILNTLLLRSCHALAIALFPMAIHRRNFDSLTCDYVQLCSQNSRGAIITDDILKTARLALYCPVSNDETWHNGEFYLPMSSRQVPKIWALLEVISRRTSWYNVRRNRCCDRRTNIFRPLSSLPPWRQLQLHNDCASRLDVLIASQYLSKLKRITY